MTKPVGDWIELKDNIGKSILVRISMIAKISQDVSYQSGVPMAGIKMSNGDYFYVTTNYIDLKALLGI